MLMNQECRVAMVIRTSQWNGCKWVETLTHWGRVMHICVSKFSILGSDNDLSPGWRQAIICTNAGLLLIGPLWTDFNGILTKIHTFSFKKMHLKRSSGKWRPFCLSLNVLTLLTPICSWLFKCLFHMCSWSIQIQHCVCRCPSTQGCWAICRHSLTTMICIIFLRYHQKWQLRFSEL